MEHLSPAAQETCTRWQRRSLKYVDSAEAAFRAVLARDEAAFRGALEELHPGRGDKGIVKSVICLSKTARHICNQRCRDPEELTETEKTRMQMVHPMTLQWGLPLGERFTPEEAGLLWRRFEPVDEVMQGEEETVLPGFQGRGDPLPVRGSAGSDDGGELVRFLGERPPGIARGPQGVSASRTGGVRRPNTRGVAPAGTRTAPGGRFRAVSPAPGLAGKIEFNPTDHMWGMPLDPVSRDCRRTSGSAGFLRQPAAVSGLLPRR